MGKAKKWTTEEKQYLEEHWGQTSLKTVARNLGRSEDAVLVMKNRMGLGAFLANGDYVSYSQLLMAVYGIDNAQSAYRENRKRGGGFPIRKKRVGDCSFKVVYLDDFWKWAEENKRLLDFTKLEENVLGAEPDWAKRKRRIDHECKVKTDPWTPAEDAKLRRLIGQYKHTYTGIAVELRRSEGGVKRRLCSLGIPGRPLKAENRPWTDEETRILVAMYDDGYSFERIGAKLNRTGLCCRGKLERIQNPGYFVRENRRQREKKAV